MARYIYQTSMLLTRSRKPAIVICQLLLFFYWFWLVRVEFIFPGNYFENRNKIQFLYYGSPGLKPEHLKIIIPYSGNFYIIL